MEMLPDCITLQIFASLGFRPRNAPTSAIRKLLERELPPSEDEVKLRCVGPTPLPVSVGKSVIYFACRKRLYSTECQDVLALVDESTPLYVHLPAFDLSLETNSSILMRSSTLFPKTTLNRVLRLAPRYNTVWLNGALLMRHSDCIWLLLEFGQIIAAFLDLSNTSYIEIFPLRLRTSEQAIAWGVLSP